MAGERRVYIICTTYRKYVQKQFSEQKLLSTNIYLLSWKLELFELTSHPQGLEGIFLSQSSSILSTQSYSILLIRTHRINPTMPLWSHR